MHYILLFVLSSTQNMRKIKLSWYVWWEKWLKATKSSFVLSERHTFLSVKWVSTWSVVTFCLRPSMSGIWSECISKLVHLTQWTAVGHKVCQCDTRAKALCMHYSILNVDSGWPFCPRRVNCGEREGKIPRPKSQLHRLWNQVSRCDKASKPSYRQGQK